MNSLVATALSEGVAQLSLALFTTLGAGGIVACIVVTLFVLLSKTDTAQKERVLHYLIIPLAAVLIGLIASTNHLGRPSNTLYVLAGVGRSPLSNEVTAVAIFAGLSWITWLLSFARERFKHVVKVLLVLVIISGFVCLWCMSNAYYIGTIITWSLPNTRLNLLFAALASGSALAVGTFMAAGVQKRKLFSWLLIGGIIATLALTISEVHQAIMLQSLQSGLHQASELVPFYPALIAVSSLVMIVGLGTLLWLWRRDAQPNGIACGFLIALVLIGVFIVRFAFYCMHLTVGL